MYTDGQIAISLGKALFGLGGNSIFKAVKNNDYDGFVKIYRDNPSSIFDVDDEENTLLMQVCVGKIDERIIDRVVSHTTQKSEFVNLQNGFRMTALMTSIVLNNEYVFDKILTKYRSLEVNKVNHKQSKTALDYAYILGNKNIISRLLENGATPYLHRTAKEQSEFEADIKKNERNRVTTLLHEETGKGNFEIVRDLIAKGADINSKNSYDETALHIACWNGRLEAVKFLIEQGGDINVKTNYGSTPLHNASYQGHLEIVKYLLSKGANKEIRRSDGDSPLDFAKEKKYKEIIYLLTDKSLLNNHGDLEQVKRLIADGADINEKDSVGQTALAQAAEAGYLEIAKLLVEKGADINVKNEQYRTPLHIASLCGHLDIAKLLISNKASIIAKDKDGKTPLDLAKEKKYKEIISLLSDKEEVIPTPVLEVTSTPILSPKAELEKKIRNLISKGTDVNAYITKGTSALHEASYYGDLPMIKLLLENNADIRIKAFNGQTPLHSASSEGALEAVKLLIMSGADPNAQDNDGWTPLHFAARKGYLEIVNYLLKSGANNKINTFKGQSSLDLARIKNYQEIISVLADEKSATLFPVTSTRNEPPLAKNWFTSILRFLIKKFILPVISLIIVCIVLLFVMPIPWIIAKLFHLNGTFSFLVCLFSDILILFLVLRKAISIFSDRKSEVKENKTNFLIWSEYQGSMNWKDAISKGINNGMRLPTIDELKTAYLAGETESWKKDGTFYWSSTSIGNDRACSLDIHDGDVHKGFQSKTHSVRYIR